MHYFSASVRSSASLSLRSKLSHLLFAACMFVLPGALAAQTVHFSGTITPVGNGFSNPSGVAVDRAGNVFVADSNTGTIKKR